MVSNSIVLVLNSLSHDGIVRLTAKEHEQFGAVVGDYFTTSDRSDNNSNGGDDLMESVNICG